MNELDKLYSPSFWSRRLSTPEEIIKYHMDFIEKASAEVRLNIPCQLNIPYGPSIRQKFDIFGTDLDDADPILIFVHGGYWQIKEIGRHSYHFIANHLYKNKIKSIFLGYELCPDVTISEIIEQLEEGTRKCFNYIQERNLSGTRIYFMGHSAGAHLVVSLYQNFMKKLNEQQRSFIKGAILISGVFNLEPIQKTINNIALKMNEEIAVKLSPMKQNLYNAEGTSFYSIVGADESPAFITQTKEFSEKLRTLGIRNTLNVIRNVDHYNIIELLSNENYELTKFILDIIKQDIA